MLPLSPTVTVHEDFAAQATEHDFAHVPLHVDESAQLMLQLSALWQLPKLQFPPAGHVQLVPVQLEGGAGVVAEFPPHDATMRNTHAGNIDEELRTTDSATRPTRSGTFARYAQLLRA